MGEPSPVPEALDTFDRSVDGRPGLKLVFAPHDYVIGKVLEDGFTITWTTRDSAVDAVSHFLALDEFGTSAVVLADGDDNFIELEEAQIFPFLQYHDCSWVKVRRQGHGDYLVYGRGREGGSNELATVGPALEPADETEARMQRVRMMMAMTASPAIQDHLETVWHDVIDTVQR